MITRLSHATFYILDYDKAKEFYVNKLGFTLKGDFEIGGGMRWVTVCPPEQPDVEIVLYKPMPFGSMDEETVTLMRKLLEKQAMSGGVFETGDCRKAYDEMSRKGVEFVSAPQQQFYGLEAIFRDGCGNWFSLSERNAQANSSAAAS